MRRAIITPGLLGFLLLMILPTSGKGRTPSAAQAKAPVITAVRCGRLIDVKTGMVTEKAILLIENERIRQVGTGLAIPAGAKVIDLGNATVLPGLIDCHTHLLQDYDGAIGEDENMLLTVAQMGTVKRALLGVKMGREDLEAGITTVRDVGNSGVNGDVALRDAIDAGWVVGPRIVAATRALSAAGGQFGHLAPEAQKIVEQEYVPISGVEEARKAVRQALYDGADCIKVIVNTGTRIVSLEEMKVIVEEAHRVRRKVAAHAIGDLPTRIAAEAGVDSIEHAYTVPDSVLKMMAEKKIYLVPTDGPLDTYVEVFAKSGNRTPEEKKEMEAGLKMFMTGSRSRLKRAADMGVPIAAGSDMYYHVPGKTRGQASLTMLRAYAESGLSPLNIIRAATINAADLLGRQNSIGTLEPGRYADLIAVSGDPLKDIGELEKVKFVMKGGAVIRNDLKGNGG